METLKTEFVKNDINYKIIERSESRYFAELSSTFSGNVIGYETGRIVRTNGGKATMGGKDVVFKPSENIVSNEQFGKDEFECSMGVKNKDYVYAAFMNGIERDLNEDE